jgi:hypothetical protein
MLVRVAASPDDGRNAVTEALPNLIENRRATLVFHRVVQQRGNGFLLAAAVLDHQRCDGEQVGNIRNVARFAALIAVQAEGMHQRFFETSGKRRERHVW